MFYVSVVLCIIFLLDLIVLYLKTLFWCVCVCVCVCADIYLFNYLIYWRERERESVSRGEGQRERDNLKQALCSAWSPTWGLIPRSWAHDLSQNQELDPQPTEPPRRPKDHLYFQEKVTEPPRR